ncbi:hypothetical protein ACGFZU_39110 [Streptomyces tendae]|uniref:hypothetical protein n=1 Tax=Streptomyces tendae TaxID=1932 RepID=UPI00371EF756
MQHPAYFLASAVPVSSYHADVADLLGDLATDHCARNDGDYSYVPDPSPARTTPRIPAPAHGSVLGAAAARPGGK